MVRRLTQEIEVLKSILRDQGLWNEAAYKKATLERFIADHNSAGAIPMISYSYYPYVLEEDSFLKHRFNASDEEIAAFNQEVATVSSLTRQPAFTPPQFPVSDRRA